MERKEFLRSLGAGAAFAITFPCLQGCSKDDMPDIPIPTGIDFTIVSQLLAFSRKQIIQPKVVNLNELLSKMKRMLLRLISEDIELSLKKSENLYAVQVDPGQVEQVIVNLAVNARDEA